TSQRSDPATLTTLAITNTPSCVVQLQIYGTGFTASATVVNSTAAAISGWTFGFSLSPAATVSNVFGGVLSRSGGSGTIKPASWNGTLGPGGQLFFGFIGYAYPAAPPSGFTFN